MTPSGFHRHRGRAVARYLAPQSVRVLPSHQKQCKALFLPHDAVSLLEHADQPAES